MRYSALLRKFLLLCTLFLFTACETNMAIIHDVDEREANEIVVFLASRGIPSEKSTSVSNAPAGGAAIPTYSISVASDKATDAMAILNQSGLPRKKGVSLLDLFAASGLMTSAKQETIRYQAGLAEQIANMIRKIDGVIEADVQLSFPTESTSVPMPGMAAAAIPNITAAVYVKHMGILDDPNSHLITKIKRLVSGSVSGLDINDVTVISDRSRFTDISLTPSVESLEPTAKEYVSIWSIVMSKSSASRFRTLFFLLIAFVIVVVVLLGWMLWKFYPVLKRRGMKFLLQTAPLEEPPPEEKK